MHLSIILSQFYLVYSQWYSGENEKQQRTTSLDTEGVSKPFSATSAVQCILECKENSMKSYFVEYVNECYCLINKTQTVIKDASDDGILYNVKHFQSCQEVKDTCIDCESDIYTMGTSYGESVKVFCMIPRDKGTEYAFMNGTTVNSQSILMANPGETFPFAWRVGVVYLGGVEDEIFYPYEIITWENTVGHVDIHQWIGFQDAAFANKLLHVECWVKFVGSVPERSDQFGIKVYGVVYNGWVVDCQADEWCKVALNIQNINYGDFNYVIIIFDSINHQQIVRIAHFTVTILY
ncbi:uncharacterized protein [Clytia hemisphaerica]|uniref:Cnidarian restricted protein n=1 Tax=Clytia hemisphaerica TaxID=252671 RepID=A0A7M5X1A3_9CNID|eukprot:TCONS_00056617-protein